jgi:hypothetical protein
MPCCGLVEALAVSRVAPGDGDLARASHFGSSSEARPVAACNDCRSIQQGAQGGAVVHQNTVVPTRESSGFFQLVEPSWKQNHVEQVDPLQDAVGLVAGERAVVLKYSIQQNSWPFAGHA